MFGIDQIKTWFTYTVAAFVVAAGFYFLFAIRTDTAAAQSAVALAITGFIASSLTFLYGQVVQSQTAHQTNVAATQLTGSPSTANGATTTTTVTPPTTTTTVTPEEPKP
jgi:hypothetical protein